MWASMVLPTFAAIALLWAGVVEDVGALIDARARRDAAGMLGAMLLRPAEYTGHGRTRPRR